MSIVAAPLGATTALPEAKRDPYEQVSLLIVHATVVIVGIDYDIGAATSATLPIALILLPLWVRSLWSYALAPLLGALVVGCVVWGYALSKLSAQDHFVRQSGQIQMTGILLSGAAALVLVLWARQCMPAWRVVALYGLGGVLGGVLEGRLGWKFGIAIPATFLVLGLVERSGSRGRAVLAVTILGLAGIADGYRSFFAFCLLAATLTIWQMRPLDDEREPSRWWPALLIAGMLTAGYMLSSTLITAGYLGEAIQERTTEQIEQSGSLLAGGRPEWAATMELMRLKPSGYGVGVVPNLADVHVAKAGLDSVNIGLNQERDRYMFGTEFRLHSIIADLWVRFGFMGVALAVTMLVALVRSLSFSLAARQAATSAILAALLGLWSMFFEPSTTYWVRTCVALGLILVIRQPRLGRASWWGYDGSPGTAAGGRGGRWRAGW